MSLDDLTGRSGRTAPGAGQPGGLVEAVIATTPVGSEPVDVLVGTQGQRTGPCVWSPVVIDGEMFTPARDDPCYVQQARKGERVIVWWEPGDGRDGDPVGPGIATYTSLPTGTADQVITYTRSWTDTGGTARQARWLLQWSVDDSRWYYCGGPALTDYVDVEEALAATFSAYQDVATIGPSLTIPFTGLYRIDTSYYGTAAAANGFQSGVKINAAAADPVKGGALTTVSAGGYGTARGLGLAVALTAGDIVKLQYRSTANLAGSVGARRLVIEPVYIT